MWRPPPRPQVRVDRNLGINKMKMPPFWGKNDPDLYLKWGKKVEHIFECHNHYERKKLKHVSIEFTDYVLNWWSQLVISRRRNCETIIDSLEDIKVINRRRFVPSS